MARHCYLIPCPTSSTTFEAGLYHFVFFLCAILYGLAGGGGLTTLRSLLCNRILQPGALDIFQHLSIDSGKGLFSGVMPISSAVFAASGRKLYITAQCAECRPQLGNGPELPFNRCDSGLCFACQNDRVTNGCTYKSSCSMVVFLPSELLQWQQQVGTELRCINVDNANVPLFCLTVVLICGRKCICCPPKSNLCVSSLPLRLVMNLLFIDPCSHLADPLNTLSFCLSHSLTGSIINSFFGHSHQITWHLCWH